MKKFTLLLFLVFLFSGCDLINDPKGITLQEFYQLKTGMSYKQVTKIIGGPGELINQESVPSDIGVHGSWLSSEIEVYNYYGEKGLLRLGSATLVFRDGYLVEKAQYDLK